MPARWPVGRGSSGSSGEALRYTELNPARAGRHEWAGTSENGRCAGFLSVVQRRCSLRNGAARHIAGYATWGAILDNRGLAERSRGGNLASRGRGHARGHPYRTAAQHTGTEFPGMAAFNVQSLRGAAR
jgi:hypothetical protein